MAIMYTLSKFIFCRGQGNIPYFTPCMLINIVWYTTIYAYAILAKHYQRPIATVCKSKSKSVLSTHIIMSAIAERAIVNKVVKTLQVCRRAKDVTKCQIIPTFVSKALPSVFIFLHRLAYMEAEGLQ